MKRLRFFAAALMAICLIVAACTSEDSNSNSSGLKIDSFSPDFGPVGTRVWITGKNFGSAPTVKIGNAIMTIDGTPTDTEIFAFIPDGATTGRISVTANGDTYTGGEFEVTEDEETDFTLNKSTLELFTLDTETLVPTITGQAGPEDIVWNSVDKNIATVDENGNIKGIKEGTTTITATLGTLQKTTIVTVRRSIYVSGSDYSSGKSIAVYWKNGNPSFLTDGQNDAYARSVFVTETDVYVCGYEKMSDNTNVAKVWKNRELLYNLSEGSSAIAHAIQVFKGDVIVSGVADGDAMLWINGTPSTLNGASAGEAYGLFVNSNAIYTSGTVENAPITWKDSEKTELTYNSDQFGIALDIFVVGTDEYAVGIDYIDSFITATIWENGQRTHLEDSDRSVAKSIFVNGGNTYVVGGDYVQNNEFPVLWKNNESPIKLEVEGGYGTANSIYIYDEDVYVAGLRYDDNTAEARVWENGIPLTMFQGMEETGFISIFVK